MKRCWEHAGKLYCQNISRCWSRYYDRFQGVHSNLVLLAASLFKGGSFPSLSRGLILHTSYWRIKAPILVLLTTYIYIHCSMFTKCDTIVCRFVNLTMYMTLYIYDLNIYHHGVFFFSTFQADEILDLVLYLTWSYWRGMDRSCWKCGI